MSGENSQHSKEKYIWELSRYFDLSQRGKGSNWISFSSAK